jgi:hypothetical protein
MTPLRNDRRHAIILMPLLAIGPLAFPRSVVEAPCPDASDPCLLAMRTSEVVVAVQALLVASHADNGSLERSTTVHALDTLYKAPFETVKFIVRDIVDGNAGSWGNAEVSVAG